MTGERAGPFFPNGQWCPLPLRRHARDPARVLTRLKPELPDAFSGIADRVSGACRHVGGRSHHHAYPRRGRSSELQPAGRGGRTRRPCIRCHVWWRESAAARRQESASRRSSSGPPPVHPGTPARPNGHSARRSRPLPGIRRPPALAGIQPGSPRPAALTAFQREKLATIKKSAHPLPLAYSRNQTRAPLEFAK